MSIIYNYSMIKTQYLTKHLIYIQYGEIVDSKKIAGFDLDGTLINPNKKYGKNRKFPIKDMKDDWEFTYENVKEVLKKMTDDGCKIIIHTNQKGIRAHEDVWIKKVKLILKELNIPCQVYCSLRDDEYRKPLMTVWKKYIDYDEKTSFYCGDAAGRQKDHSDTDYKLALNLKIPFLLPEKVFEGWSIKLNTIGYTFPPISSDVSKKVFKLLTLLPNKKEYKKHSPAFELTMILNVGFPGSGKSWFANTYLKPLGFHIICRDILKTITVCVNLARTSLHKGISIVIDNTNLDKAARKEWYEIAKEYKAKVIILYFTTSLNICRHNNIYRHVVSNGKYKLIPQIVYKIMTKKFEEPDITENEKTEILTIPFQFTTNKLIDQTKELEVYKQYLF